MTAPLLDRYTLWLFCGGNSPEINRFEWPVICGNYLYATDRSIIVRVEATEEERAFFEPNPKLDVEGVLKEQGRLWSEVSDGAFLPIGSLPMPFLRERMKDVEPSDPWNWEHKFAWWGAAIVSLHYLHMIRCLPGSQLGLVPKTANRNLYVGPLAFRFAPSGDQWLGKGVMMTLKRDAPVVADRKLRTVFPADLPKP